MADMSVHSSQNTRLSQPYTLPESPQAQPQARVGATRRSARVLSIGALAVAALGAAAVFNHRRAVQAERAHPPVGRFLNVDGVRLHYLERGTGKPVVLLHGNGGMIQDFLSSGLVDEAARQHRVVVFDRPGYGYSERPRGKLWTPDAQADLLAAALRQLGISGAVVLGHSWASAVAVALAHKHPSLAGGLVLEAGYFYPSPRLDLILFSVPAIPVLGDVLRRTVSPPLGRLAWPFLIRKIFSPAPEPETFRAFPREMALRPLHMRASAEESALMVLSAVGARNRYAKLRVPVAIIAGEEDSMVDAHYQSARLHQGIPQSSFTCLPGTGHIPHHTAMPAVLAAIESIAQAS